MDYLGGLRGTGVLLCGADPVAPVDYDLDGFVSRGGQVTSSGELRLPPTLMKSVFGRTDLQVRTAENRLLQFRFSEKKQPPHQGAAHVDLVGTLPAITDWRRRSGAAIPMPLGREDARSAPSPHGRALPPRSARG